MKKNWKEVVLKAWSIRFLLLSFLFSGLDIGLELYVNNNVVLHPWNVILPILAGLAAVAAGISRVIPQSNLPTE